MQNNGKDTSPHLRDGLRIEIGFGLLSKHLSEASYQIHKKILTTNTYDRKVFGDCVSG